MLRERRGQIDAEILRIEAKLRVDARKEDTRRKILIGALMLQEMQSRPDIHTYVRRLLNERLTKPRDRDLFGLNDPLPPGDSQNL